MTPTKTFSQQLELELAGVELQLLHAPGETEDQLMVWYPAKRTLFPADNIYKAFPNLWVMCSASKSSIQMATEGS